jgi:outer membrane protein assembly factor BamB
METTTSLTPSARQLEVLSASAPTTPRFWPAIVLLALFFAFQAGAEWVEMSMFVRFISRMVAHALLLLLFLAWWLTNRRLSRADRWLAVGVVVAGAAVAGMLSDPTVGIFGLVLSGLPYVLAVWTGWFLLTRQRSARLRRLGFCAVVALTWGYFDLVRWDGLDGGQHSALSWRWQPSAEELFLAESAGRTLNPALTTRRLTLRAGDWPEFRGAQRDGQVRGLKLVSNWNQQPPRLVWRRRVGPAWSSMILVDGLLFTQEQRGPHEAVVGYDAASGEEVWAHLDEARFYEGVSGPGPRSTPTFADGKIYALGARGRLNCLDAASGKKIWSRDIVADAGATVPQWGFSNSPLVVAGTVIVFAGGQEDRGLLAYRDDTDSPVWSIPTGKNSYSSPTLASIAGVRQLLMLSDRALTAVDVAAGRILWEHDLVPDQVFMPIAQPQVIAGEQILVQSGAGLALVNVKQQQDQWLTHERWRSTAMKLSLGDFVIKGEHIYGFNDGIFSCLDLSTGKRRWRGGRYGHGQVLALADQSLLLVLSEEGEVVLLAADRQQLNELGRFQAIQGKTWNHPALAHGRLYVRNAEEMACYELGALAEFAIGPRLSTGSD